MSAEHKQKESAIYHIAFRWSVKEDNKVSDTLVVNVSPHTKREHAGCIFVIHTNPCTLCV